MHGTSGQVRTEPESAGAALPASVVDKTFLVTMDKSAGAIQGQKLVSRPGSALGLLTTWTLSVPGSEVMLVAGKDPEERVHSQVKI